MSITEYVENISLGDAELIQFVLDEEISLALRLGETTEPENLAVKEVDQIIASAPATDKKLVLYKGYKGSDELYKGGELIDRAFMVTSSKKLPLNGAVVLEIMVPKGTHLLELSNGICVLGRGLKLDLEPTDKDKIISATLIGKTSTKPKKESAIETKSTGNIQLWHCDIHEFFNECHAPDDGQFCSGSSSGGVGGDAEGEEEGGSKGLTEEQREDIKKAGHKVEDYDASGKPIPGSDSWLDAHGIERKVYEGRPNARWKNSKDPVFDEVYQDFPPKQKNFAKKIASREGGEQGIIMVRKPAPGAEEAGFGKLPPQARPDRAIVLDPRDVVKRTRELENSKARVEKVRTFTPEDIVAERQAKANKTKAEIRRLETHTAEEIRQPVLDARDLAEAKLNKAKKSGDPEKIAVADKVFRQADWKAKEEKRVAHLVQHDQTRAIGIAKQEHVAALKALDRAKADPQKALKNAQDFADGQVVKKERQLNNVAVKYVFPKGAGNAARIEVHQDPQNIKNLTQGKGRVYFVMEGNIKADAALSAVKKEDPKAAVLSVPSVTAWPKDETDWVASKYLKGREVVLIPDADGVTNKAVTNQATKLAGKLRSNGVENVLVAAPPLARTKGGKLFVQELTLPSGAKDARKGLDDHLGLGRGTLGDLTYADTKPPNFDLTQALTEKRVRRTAIPNANKAMNAISDLAGDRGAGRISYDSVSDYTGLSPTSARDSTRLLEKHGIIKIHHIFEPSLLGEGRREPAMEYDEIKRITRKAGVSIPDLDIRFVSEQNKHETAAIIEVLDKKYLTKAGPSKTLASKYKGLKTSVGAPKPPPPSIRVIPGRRVVRTPEGAKRYGVPIGSPIPVETEAGLVSSATTFTGNITVVSDTSSSTVIIPSDVLISSSFPSDVFTSSSSTVTGNITVVFESQEEEEK